jgi:hypothetical protein
MNDLQSGIQSSGKEAQTLFKKAKGLNPNQKMELEPKGYFD